MAEDNSEGGSPFPLNLNTILAVVTLVGGLWLVSHKLASDRPVASPGSAQPFPGEQTLAARLWEDPFKSPDADNSSDETRTNWEALIDQIQERSEGTNHVLLFPVMLGGGQYSEDQESRIRSRYAIVSALLQSGFAPDDAEHIGSLQISWPTQHEVKSLKNHKNPPLTKFWKDRQELNFTSSATMQLRYEWYRPRTFFPRNDREKSAPAVLVLWLDDSFFEDDPLLRLPLLLEPLIGSNPDTQVSFIGPRRSSTLRAMLPGRLSGVPPLSNVANQSLWSPASNILSRIDVYCATPSVMDEVLVTETNLHDIPREAVKREMRTNGVKSFHNFTATDRQLARELFDELASDNIELTNPKNHLVLISESDTFYGRMLSLTYAAELKARQTTNQTSCADFVTNWMAEANDWPTNFHAFAYLRGLDGQTIGPNQGAGDNTGAKDAGQSHPATLDDLRNWTPDANKAEGQAQFDYLSRLGGQLAGLQNYLRREKSGDIKAVGIVGSDVYDTLLILQALRHQLPDAVFFTTDLDARFLNPTEAPWTRGLLVVSDYGLSLHPKLQGSVAAFRESAQSAQFAAALAALGNESLTNLAYVSPRRFKIGKQVAVDWSVSNTSLAAVGDTNGLWLHPLTPGEIGRSAAGTATLLAWGCLGFAILIGACCFLPPLRRLTFDGFHFCGEILEYTEEDFGGPDGAASLLKKIRSNADPVSLWLWDNLPKKSAHSAANVGDENADNDLSPAEALAKQANRILRDKKLIKEFWGAPKSVSRGGWIMKMIGSTQLSERLHARRCFDQFLLEAMPPGKENQNDKKTKADDVGDINRASASARNATMEIFRLRYWRLRFYWLWGGISTVLCCLLAGTIWQNTFDLPTGEPFSLTSGVSAWPGGILRLLAIIFTVWFVFQLYYRMRETYFSLTRQFRLTIPSEKAAFGLNCICHQVFFFFQPLKEPEADNTVSVSDLWMEHYQNGRFLCRLMRIILPFALYVGILAVICQLTGASFDEPVRGTTARVWNGCLMNIAGLGFIALAFLTVDSALICRRFILELGRRSVEYHAVTRQYFSREAGNIDLRYIDGWIGLQLIVELTEQVGRLVYYPTGILLLLLLARNGWWDTWTCPPIYVLVFGLNLLLALASVFILQRTAKNSKTRAEAKLATEAKRLQAKTARSSAENDANQAAQLLEEMHQLRRGAFVPFWENPIVTTLFASSGGITILQILIWAMGK